MVQSQLSAYSGNDPIWGFVALVGSELFTGEAAVGLDPRVRLFAVDGRIYFAEREDDAPVGTRLVNCGAISANQLARGAVQAGGHESLARLFQRDATIDRDAVELTIEASTESLLASIAHNPVGMPEVFPLRHHSAGIHHWLHGAPLVVAAEDVTVEEVASPPIMPELATMPVPDPVAVVDPIDAVYPAPKLPTEPAVPEWPHVDDEPVWAVPADARELAPLVELPVMAEAPVAAMATVATTAAELPRLASLSSIQIPSAATNPFQPTTQPTAQPTSSATATATATARPSTVAVDLALPKLAAGPMSIKDLKQELTNAAAASEPWTSGSKNMAAVQIWEMVDDMFDDGKKQDPRMGSGAPQVRTRGWLRKKG